VRLTIDIVPSLLNVVGVLWGMFVTALIALLLAPLVERGAERQILARGRSRGEGERRGTV